MTQFVRPPLRLRAQREPALSLRHHRWGVQCSRRRPQFHEARRLSDEDTAAAQREVHIRVLRLFERRGLLAPEAAAEMRQWGVAAAFRSTPRFRIEARATPAAGSEDRFSHRRAGTREERVSAIRPERVYHRTSRRPPSKRQLTLMSPRTLSWCGTGPGTNRPTRARRLLGREPHRLEHQGHGDEPGLRDPGPPPPRPGRWSRPPRTAPRARDSFRASAPRTAPHSLVKRRSVVVKIGPDQGAEAGRLFAQARPRDHRPGAAGTMAPSASLYGTVTASHPSGRAHTCRILRNAPSSSPPA